MKPIGISVLATAGLLLSFSGSALAASGTVTGQFFYFENEGNFCPTNRNCTGAKYVQSQFNTSMPVADTKVFVKRASDGVVIGQGSTNASGTFTVSWSTGFFDFSQTVSATFTWIAEHKDMRFYVRHADGSQRNFFTWAVNITNGANTNVGGFTWGWSGNPDPYANLYGGAWRMWALSLGQSNRMVSYFSNVQILGETDPSGGNHADVFGNKVFISPAGSYAPQSTIMHEMGHIASFRASRDQNVQTGVGNLLAYPNTACGPTDCWWDLPTSEWEAAAFEDSMATHLADVGMYFANAPQPHSCISASACGTNSYNLETSGGTSCGTGQNRTVLNHMRYHWDNYDSLSDYTGENLSRGVWEAIDTINAFDNGYGNRQKNEPFATNSWNLDDWDGRSDVDFRENWITFGTNSSTQLSNNCGSAGD